MSGTEWLRLELRRLREAADLSQESFGQRIHFSTSHVGAVERGDRPILPGYLRAIDNAHGTALVTLYRQFIRGEWTPAHYRPFVEYEGRATLLRVFHPALVPGLLQTEAYARALLPAVDVPPEELEQTLAARLDRQEVITRDSRPCHLATVVDESALHRLVGNPEVMRDQLKALASAGDRQHLQVHVIPADTPVYVGLLGPMVLATVEGRCVGFLERYLDGQLIESPNQIEALERKWEIIRGYALSAQQSRELIMRVAEKWT
ncbi:helix-turn-helix transcriptional regulator [Solwaraspora sp. WMMD406]|uniref:helix-turn-helix domain-containing protein n=1 Tax=Solwaraspora sp. WMMD406 TaxID=3016095 RepID=UPI002417CFD2|nr:helix-turn-helix transcriptional regulator [Solwaraspora sp. WMMD406]MDG4762897.1 helix-turn-helix transcriptional regulator [Solwaraspora sp. WMMD406]